MREKAIVFIERYIFLIWLVVFVLGGAFSLSIAGLIIMALYRVAFGGC